MLLDGLDPDAVASDAMSTAFGRYPLPAAVAGVVGAPRVLSRAAATDRPGVRQLATARHAGVVQPGNAPPAGRPGDWSVRWARLVRRPAHLTLHGHTGSVAALCALSVSAELTLVASGAVDGTIRLTDPRTGTFWGEPVTAGSAVTALSALRLPGGRLALACGTESGTIRLRDPVAGTPLGRPFATASAVRAVCELPTDAGAVLLAAGGDGGVVEVWDPGTGEQVSPAIRIGGHRAQGADGPVRALCAVAGPDGGTLLAAGGDESLVVFDPVARTAVWRRDLDPHDRVNTLCATPPADGRSVLIWATRHGCLGLWDPGSGRSASSRHPRRIKQIAAVCAFVGTDGRTTLALGGDGPDEGDREGVLSIIGGLGLGLGHGHGHEPDSFSSWFSPGDADADADAVAWISLGPGRRPTACCAVQPGKGHTLVALGTRTGDITLWSPDDAQPSPAAGHAGRVHGVIPIPRPDGGTVLASGGQDRSVRFWHPDTGAPAGETIEPGYSVAAIGAAVVDDDDRVVIAAAGAGDVVRLYDAASGHDRGRLQTANRTVDAVCGLSLGDGQALIATAGDSGTVQLWDPATGERRGQQIDVGDRINRLCPVALPHARGVLAIGTDADENAVLLWDPETGTDRRLAGPAACVTALCPVPHPDGRTLLATGSKYGSLALWDPTTGRPVGRPTENGPTPWAVCVATSPAGDTLLASGGYSHRVRLWHPATLEHVHDVDVETQVFGMCAVGPDLMLGTDTGVVVIRLDDRLFPASSSSPALGDDYPDALARLRWERGDDHPDTLAAATDLAAALAGRGEHRAARELGVDTLARQRRVLGDDHPDTRKSEEILRWEELLRRLRRGRP
jgi:WD40 repeat protein